MTCGTGSSSGCGIGVTCGLTPGSSSRRPGVESMLCPLGCWCMVRGSVVAGCILVVRSCCAVVLVVHMGWVVAGMRLVVVVRMSWVVVGMVGRVWLGV